MIRGAAKWSYDPSANAWYVELDERADPPYRNNTQALAILDLDDGGRLAGIEVLSDIGPPLRAVETSAEPDGA